MKLQATRPRFALATLGSLVACATLAFAPAQTATDDGLHAYEGFDYPQGQLRGRDGGVGWDGGWRDAHQRVEADESLTSALGQTPEVTGGHVRTPNGDWPARRTLSEPFAAEPGIYWMAVLAANVDQQIEDTYLRVRIAPIDGTAVAVGKGFGARNWGLEVGGKFHATRTESNDRGTLLVARITVGEAPETSSVALFVDPDLDSEPLTPDAEVTRVTIRPFIELLIQSGVGEKVFAVDEIRLGRSYRTVVPSVE